MTKAMKMLEDFRKCASYRNERHEDCLFGVPIDIYLGDLIKCLNEEYASMERIVRDAICSYEESFPDAPNDECERELKERAQIANKWLVDHGFEPEKFTWSKEELPCL